MSRAVADPGFPIGGRGPIRGGVDPPMQALFGENYVKMKQLGPMGGVRPARPLDPPMKSHMY